jgi:hypothetical protein
MEVEASTLVARRMMARLVHIPYQLFQPNEFDSIIDSARAFEMPEAPSPETELFYFRRAGAPTRAAVFLARGRPNPLAVSFLALPRLHDLRWDTAAVRETSRPNSLLGWIRWRPFSGDAAPGGTPHRGDPIPKPGALWQCPFSIRLPSRPACGIFSLRARATAPQRVPHRRARLPPLPRPSRPGNARTVRAPACLPSCFMMLRNTSLRRRGRTARLVLDVPLVHPRRICPVHASASCPQSVPTWPHRRCSHAGPVRAGQMGVPAFGTSSTLGETRRGPSNRQRVSRTASRRWESHVDGWPNLE